MNLPHLNEATQIYTGMENLKPKDPFIIHTRHLES